MSLSKWVTMVLRSTVTSDVGRTTGSCMRVAMRGSAVATCRDPLGDRPWGSALTEVLFGNVPVRFILDLQEGALPFHEVH